MTINRAGKSPWILSFDSKSSFNCLLNALTSVLSRTTKLPAFKIEQRQLILSSSSSSSMMVADSQIKATDKPSSDSQRSTMSTQPKPQYEGSILHLPLQRRRSLLSHRFLITPSTPSTTTAIATATHQAPTPPAMIPTPSTNFRQPRPPPLTLGDTSISLNQSIDENPLMRATLQLSTTSQGSNIVVLQKRSRSRRPSRNLTPTTGKGNLTIQIPSTPGNNDTAVLSGNDTPTGSSLRAHSRKYKRSNEHSLSRRMSFYTDDAFGSLKDGNSNNDNSVTCKTDDEEEIVSLVQLEKKNKKNAIITDEQHKLDSENSYQEQQSGSIAKQDQKDIENPIKCCSPKGIIHGKQQKHTNAKTKKVVSNAQLSILNDRTSSILNSRNWQSGYNLKPRVNSQAAAMKPRVNSASQKENIDRSNQIITFSASGQINHKRRPAYLGVRKITTPKAQDSVDLSIGGREQLEIRQAIENQLDQSVQSGFKLEVDYKSDSNSNAAVEQDNHSSTNQQRIDNEVSSRNEKEQISLQSEIQQTDHEQTGLTHEHTRNGQTNDTISAEEIQRNSKLRSPKELQQDTILQNTKLDNSLSGTFVRTKSDENNGINATCNSTTQNQSDTLQTPQLPSQTAQKPQQVEYHSFDDPSDEENEDTQIHINKPQRQQLDYVASNEYIPSFCEKPKVNKSQVVKPSEQVNLELVKTLQSVDAVHEKKNSCPLAVPKSMTLGDIYTVNQQVDTLKKHASNTTSITATLSNTMQNLGSTTRKAQKKLATLRDVFSDDYWNPVQFPRGYKIEQKLEKMDTETARRMSRTGGFSSGNVDLLPSPIARIDDSYPPKEHSMEQPESKASSNQSVTNAIEWNYQHKPSTIFDEVNDYWWKGQVNQKNDACTQLEEQLENVENCEDKHVKVQTNNHEDWDDEIDFY